MLNCSSNLQRGADEDLMDTVDEPIAADPSTICKYDTLQADILLIEPPGAQRLNGWLKTWYHRTLEEVIIINMKNL